MFEIEILNYIQLVYTTQVNLVVVVLFAYTDWLLCEGE